MIKYPYCANCGEDSKGEYYCYSCEKTENIWQNPYAIRVTRKNKENNETIEVKNFTFNDTLSIFQKRLGSFINSSLENNPDSYLIVEEVEI